MDRLNDIYNQIVNDKEVLDTYKKVDECDNNMWALHGVQHVTNVVKTVESVLCQLNCDKNLITKAKIAAFLHDVGSVEGKDGHAERSAIFCEKYLKNFSFIEDEIEELLFAIKNHGNFVEGGGLLLAALVLADKLDIDKTRLGEAGYEIEGMKELQWINKITIVIDDKFRVSFSCDENFNRESFEEFYFCRKVFDAINSFAKIIGKQSEVLLNKKEWVY